MEIQEQSQRAEYLIEAAGLFITGLLLLVIACCLQLAVRLLTHGALEPRLGILAFGFLFYVFAGFLSVGTRQRPDDPSSLVANVALSAAFMVVGWLCWRSEVSGSTLALALAFTVVAHGLSYAFARLRRRTIRQLQRHRDVIQDAFVERLFRVQSATYRAIPIGAALGLAFGSLATRAGSSLTRDALAGVFAVLALDELLRIGTGALVLARGARSAKYPVRVQAALGAHTHATLNADAAADIRRILLLNLLQRTTRLALVVLVLGQLVSHSALR